MPTPDIFDFDSQGINYEEAGASAALLDFPDLYVNHLLIARHLDGWAVRAEERSAGPGEEFDRGFVHGLREVCAHLRQADYVPTGIFVRDEREAIDRAISRRAEETDGDEELA